MSSAINIGSIMVMITDKPEFSLHKNLMWPFFSRRRNCALQMWASSNSCALRFCVFKDLDHVATKWIKSTLTGSDPCPSIQGSRMSRSLWFGHQPPPLQECSLCMLLMMTGCNMSSLRGPTMPSAGDMGGAFGELLCAPDSHGQQPCVWRRLPGCA